MTEAFDYLPESQRVAVRGALNGLKRGEKLNVACPYLQRGLGCRFEQRVGNAHCPFTHAVAPAAAAATVTAVTTTAPAQARKKIMKLSEYRVWVEVGNDKLKDGLLAQGIPAEFAPAGQTGMSSSHEHPYGAGAREWATVWVLCDARSEGFSQVIDLWGSDRTHTLSQRVGGPSVIVHGTDTYQPKDIRRPRHPEVERIGYIPNTRAPSAFLMVNVYHAGEDMLNLRWIANLLEVGETLYWVGHVYNGACGVTFREGAWLRLADGSVLHKADKAGTPYCDHVPSWTLTEGVRGGLAWTHAFQVGRPSSLYVIQFKKVDIMHTGVAKTVEKVDFLHGCSSTHTSVVELPIANVPFYRSSVVEVVFSRRLSRC